MPGATFFRATIHYRIVALFFAISDLALRLPILLVLAACESHGGAGGGGAKTAELETKQGSAGGFSASLSADLAREMGSDLRYDSTLGGYPVWLFSDLKRHDMGPANAARHPQNGVSVREYLTPRLWGVADSAPYLHDGRAPSFDYAVAGHDGEGAAARAAFTALPFEEKNALRVYLISLRRSSRLVVP